MPVFPFDPSSPIAAIGSFPSVGDFNNDGLVELFGSINLGNGTYSSAPIGSIQSILANYPGRVSRTAHVVDINGDGNLDVFWNVYSDPAIADSFSLILYGDGTGAFPTFDERRDVNGFGETIVAADFNNDGLSDIFSPVYTHVLGTDANYLLFNNGGVLGSNQAVEWGVALANQPAFLRVEGAQGTDINFDGWIDIYTSSHLFINQQTHFSEIVLDFQIFDEGSNLFDYDNDGDFDLALRTEFGGVKLYEWAGSGFAFARNLTEDADTPGIGLNSYDADSNGWEDLVLSTSSSTIILFNDNGVFEASTVPSIRFDSFAFADLNQDGRIDLLGGASSGGVHLSYNSTTSGDSVRLSVLGSNGERNQQGRSIRLISQDQPDLILARSIESGSGYLTQNQYEKIIGLPASGAYAASVALASGAYTFTLSAGQNVQVFADGRVVIEGSAVDDSLGGGSGADSLMGLVGTDLFLGSAGADSIDGGAGVDTLDFSAHSGPVTVDLFNETALASGSLQHIISIENVIGTSFDDLLFGDGAANILTGGDGDDRLDGLGGDDNVQGGAGDDIYVIDQSGDLITELPDSGSDTVETSLPGYVLPDQVERAMATSASAQDLTGNALDNRFEGTIGGHSFAGLAGDDLYLVKAGDTVTEAPNAGFDRVETDLPSYTLPDHVEVLAGTSQFAQALGGNAADNFLSGTAANDSLAGHEGNDSYDVNSGDSVIELINEGIDHVNTALPNYTLADHVENLTGTALTSQNLVGNALGNIFRDNATGSSFAGGEGDDTYFVGQSDLVNEVGNQGVDEVITALPSYTLTANVENLTGTGASGQKLVGNAGDNVIAGGIGADTLIGQGGNDTYFVNRSNDFVNELVNDGYDRIFTAANYLLASSAVQVEELLVTDPLSITALFLGGNSLDNRITGNAGNNELDGSLGADTLIGLGGNDVYVVDNVNDQVIEAMGEGTDQVVATISYVLAPDVSGEILRTQNNNGTVPLALTGNNLVNTVIGNAGNNLLDGGGGNDHLFGLGGDDIYLVDNANDLVFESAGSGQDRIRAAVSYQLRDDESVEFIETSDMAGTAALVLTGNNLVNTIIGNAGNNELDGKGGADILTGLGGNDVYVIDNPGDQIIEGVNGGADRIAAEVSYGLAPDISVEILGTRDANGTAAINLTGNALVNQVNGNAGNNVLDGGLGNDTLSGFGGNDIYVVDSANDLVNEAVGGGQDRIRVNSLFYELRASVEVEVLETSDAAGTAAIGLTGNNLVNSLIGNAGNNILDGGGGADVLNGLGGNDVYVVDNAEDQVVESANGGTDRIAAMVSYVLAADISVETLGTRDISGITEINLTGNNLVNSVIGNAGNNRLDGGGGNDSLFGLSGDDLYVVDSANDLVFESVGNGEDRLQTSVSYQLRDNQAVEFVETVDASGTAPLFLAGNNLVNTVTGNAGNNEIDGRGGADILSGLGGNDVYVIDNALDQVVEGINGGADRIAATVSYILAADVSVETLGTRDMNGITAINLTGNDLDNSLIGNAASNSLDGGGGNDSLFGLGGDDLIRLLATDGRDFIDGGTGSDTFQLDGTAAAETFNIYTRAAFLTANPGATLNGNSEIVITRDGSSVAHIVAELDNIEEITINTFNTTVNDGNGNVNGGTAGGDTINVFGNFTQTSLNYSTISIEGSAANDTVDITGLSSAHRIVFNTQGGNDRIIGPLRPQDVFTGPASANLAEGPNVWDAGTAMHQPVGTTVHEMASFGRGSGGLDVMIADSLFVSPIDFFV